jgi:hypothetical protein
LVELSVEAFHASEMLVGVVAVIRRSVGVVGADGSPGGGGGGLLAGAAAMKTSARARTLAANTELLADIGAPSVRWRVPPLDTAMGPDRI